MREKILLGMSGGLDSSYSAVLLRQAGYDVEGAVLRMHEYSDTDGARRAADALSIPLRIIDCAAEFSAVRDYLCREYAAGRTPNPCVFCNREVKFRILAREASRVGITRIATGHYAGITQSGGRFAVRRALSLKKDQSYVLWSLPQEILGRAVFPLEKEEKTDIRAKADAIGLPAAHAAESQEICFLPDGGLPEYIESRLGRSFPHGDFVDEGGRVIGEHNGIIRYTVGQRKGLGGTFGRPMFVRSIDAAANRIVLAEEKDVFSDSVRVGNIVFSGAAEGDGEYKCSAKLRYSARPVPATVTVCGGGAEVRLREPVRAVTPGQSAVFYSDGDVILFGGVIL